MPSQLLFGVSALFCVSVISASSCSWDSRAGATFDLSALQKSTPYAITDGDIPCTVAVEQNYTYYFDVCQEVFKPTGSEVGKCAKNGASLQVDPKNPSNCWVAGKLGNPLAWSLIDSATPDPSKGVKLTYSGGEVCHQNGLPRTTTLIFECANDAFPNPTTAFEPTHCQYEIKMPSFYGCPLECPISGRALCGGNGLCAYDTTIGQARCFCNTGFGGADCTAKAEVTTSGFNGAVIGLLVTVFIISLLLAAALFVLVKQVRAYREDATNYMQIHGEEMMSPNGNI